MISLCVPTRGRPSRFTRMVRTAEHAAEGKIEVCAWLDEDDPTVERYRPHPGVVYGSGPRPIKDYTLYTSELWTRAASLASGDILMLGADDNIFVTAGWDTAVERAFDSVPDRIALVYCDDGTGRHRPEAPFVSREWIAATKEFTPPGYQGWFSDVWLWNLAAQIERVIHIPDVLIRHDQRRGSDETYRDGDAARGSEGGPLAVRERFYSERERARREVQVARLRARMTDDVRLVPEPEPEWYAEARRKA